MVSNHELCDQHVYQHCCGFLVDIYNVSRQGIVDYMLRRHCIIALPTTPANF